MVAQAKVIWSGLDAALSWEDVMALKERFPNAPNWGQAGSKGEADVSNADGDDKLKAADGRNKLQGMRDAHLAGVGSRPATGARAGGGRKGRRAHGAGGRSTGRRRPERGGGGRSTGQSTGRRPEHGAEHGATGRPAAAVDGGRGGDGAVGARRRRTRAEKRTARA
eukprot:XP_020401027.1 glycine-rich RNA-binding protein-like [Zea mays]